MPGRHHQQRLELDHSSSSPYITLKTQKQPPSGGIHRIPPEILGQIFVACLEETNLECDHAAFHPYNNALVPNITTDSAPLVLLRVSKEWRRVALGTPELFTRIFLHGQINVDPSIIVPFWLEHSGTLPLDVIIQPEIWYPPSVINANKGAIVRPILAQLHRNNHRIRTLRCGALLDEFFPNVPMISMPVLREFTLTASSPAYRPSKGSYSFGPVTASNLEIFQLMPGAHYHHALEFVGWGDRLRIFRNEGLFQCLSELADIMLRAPNLEVCVLRMGARTTGSGRLWEDMDINLPRLRHLYLSPIGSDEFQDLRPFLARLHAPALEEFDVQNNIDTMGRHLPSQDWKSTFLSLFPSPYSNLKILRLRWFDMDSIDLASLLPKFSQLEELCFEWANCDETVFRTLGSAGICPKLSSIAFVFLRITGSGLTEMLAERVLPRDDRAQLKEVCVCHCKGVGDEERMTLSSMAEEHRGIQWDIVDH
ncbi:hypothetical protein M422DRAFT_777706 [Sphaerobolus stellatus SS14]|nr:hypothetical protein M422DRAFT_777706 [Sphaerobolus stellatus SS14]